MFRLINCTLFLLAFCELIFAQSATFPGLNGLGASTLTCVDRDGDGYGTGPGCLGPDADDLDATIHTGPQAIAKYGTLTAFLGHLGYNPLRIWYIATNGNDTSCVSSGAPVGIGSPCLTYTPVGTNLAAGDMVIYRGGTYLESSRFVPTVNGTSANPIIAMSYPGEMATIDTSATLSSDMAIFDESYLIIDGFKLTKGQNNGCIAGGSTNSTATSNAFSNNTFRHIEAYACFWGLTAIGADNLLIEDSVWHDNSANGGQHGIYLGSRGTEVSINDTIRRNIFYNNGWNGIHANGSMNNMVMEQNISYGNGIANFDWQNGISNSFFRSNLSIGPGQSAGLSISVYDGNEGTVGCGPSQTDVCVCLPTANAGAICAHDQMGNLIENFTAYGTTNGSDGSSAVNVPAIIVAHQGCSTTNCLSRNLGNNTYRNIVAVVNTDGSGAYMPIVYPQTGTGWPQSSTFDHMVLWDNDAAHKKNVFGYGLGSSVGSFGYLGYPCSSPPSGVTLTNCTNADPQFVSASATYSSSPSSFNFGLNSTSPAAGTGTTVGISAFDLFGNPFGTTPSMGAIQQAQATATTPPTKPPTVSITAPSANSTVSVTVAISASATTSSGTLSVTSVQFQVDGTNLGPPVTRGPAFTVNWDTTQYFNGLHTLTALATDSGGNTGTASISVTVSNAATGPSSLGGTGWQDLANTQLQNVCPADNFGGINYPFYDYCHSVVSAWGGAAADTKRNRLIIWGGGHTDYSGNEVYSLNLGLAAPTLTRLTNPSDFTKNPAGCPGPDSNIVDGTPVSRHTYGGIVYLPVQDKLFSFGGVAAPCGGFSNHTYTLDLSQTTPAWSAMDPVNGYNPGSLYQSNNAICGYDPNTLTVICVSSSIDFFRYYPATNTYTQLSTNSPVPYASFGVIDPKRNLFIFMGVAYQSTTPHVVAVDISSGSNFAAQDWSSQVTGCDALAGASYPGLVYDPVLDRIVGWPNAGNVVYVFNPDLKTCTAQTFPNGPSNIGASPNGTFGRFQYFPGLNAYAVVNSATLDAYKLTLSTSAGAPVAARSNPCDLNGDGVVDTLDVQAAINQALGITACGTAALQQAGQCNVIDVQRVIDATLGGACLTGQ